jgi:hypothetical protein
LSKIKCFSCHKHDHYASQHLEKKKGKGKQQQKQVATSAETQMNEFVAKFEKYFSLLPCLSTSAISRNARYVDSGASRHMTSIQRVFCSMKKQDLGVQVELGDYAKYPIVGVGTIPFQLELGNSLDFDDLLFVLGLSKNFLSVSVMEDKGFAVEFKNQQDLISSKDSILHIAQVIGVREGNLYKLQGEPI